MLLRTNTLHYTMTIAHHTHNMLNAGNHNTCSGAVEMQTYRMVCEKALWHMLTPYTFAYGQEHLQVGKEFKFFTLVTITLTTQSQDTFVHIKVHVNAGEGITVLTT